MSRCGLYRGCQDFAQMIRDQFDVLYEDDAKTGRVLSICLHPFLIGHPHRNKYLDKALAYITSRRNVWMATGGEIADW
jgi:allantoinase